VDRVVEPVAPAGKPEARSRSRRVIFIDLARALAVVFMLYGHAIDGLLDPQYRAGTWFAIWTFQRGLTSCLFLLLSGFAFSIATARHWVQHVVVSPALFKRARRFGLFVLLGYALHFPVNRIVELSHIPADRWEAFLAVDVLQLIGVTFFGVQLLVLLVQSRRVFMAASFGLAMGLVVLTPAAWSIDWLQWLPRWLAGYFTQATGSLFPVVPWAAYVLVGAGLGQIYARWGASHLRRYANLGLLAPGVLLVASGLAADGLHLFGTGEWSFIPPQFLVRTGACLLVMGVIARASAHIGHLPHMFGAVAQETLLIYFVHLCIVYGSIWNQGLVQRYGETLGPGRMAAVVVLLLAAMTGLASFWNWWKHAHPHLARATMFAAWGVLIYRLI
jgi:uncharacterized membrane protein